MRDVYLPPGTAATPALTREAAERHARLAHGAGTPADVGTLLEGCIAAVVGRRAALSPEQLSFAAAALAAGWCRAPRRESNDAKHAARRRAGGAAAASTTAAAAEAQAALEAHARGERSALECVGAFAAAFARHASSAAQLAYLVRAAADDVDASCEHALCGGALAAGVRAALAACRAADDDDGAAAAVGAARAALDPRSADERSPQNWLLRHGGLCRGGAGEPPMPDVTLLLMHGFHSGGDGVPLTAGVAACDDDAGVWAATACADDALPLLLPTPTAAPLAPSAAARCDAVTRLARLAAALRAPRAAPHASPLAAPPAALPAPPPLRACVPAMRGHALEHLQHGCALLSVADAAGAAAAGGAAVQASATAAWASGLCQADLFALTDATSALACRPLNNVAVTCMARKIAFGNQMRAGGAGGGEHVGAQ
jgi:hypothetical protein